MKPEDLVEIPQPESGWPSVAEELRAQSDRILNIHRELIRRTRELSQISDKLDLIARRADAKKGDLRDEFK